MDGMIFALLKQMALVSNVEFHNDHPPLFLWDVCNLRQCYHLIKSGQNQSSLHNVWEDVVIVTSPMKALLTYCCTPVSIAGPLGTFSATVMIKFMFKMQETFKVYCWVWGLKLLKHFCHFLYFFPCWFVGVENDGGGFCHARFWVVAKGQVLSGPVCVL